MDNLETISCGIGGIIAGCALTYFALASGARTFIRDATGKNEEIDVNMKKSGPLRVQSVTIYAEKEDTDRRFSDVHAKLGVVQTHVDQKFEQARIETEEKIDAMETRTSDKLDDMASDAVEGRRILHDKVDAVRADGVEQATELRKEMASIPTETINLMLKTKELNRP